MQNLFNYFDILKCYSYSLQILFTFFLIGVLQEGLITYPTLLHRFSQNIFFLKQSSVELSWILKFSIPSSISIDEYSE